MMKTISLVLSSFVLMVNYAFQFSYSMVTNLKLWLVIVLLGSCTFHTTPKDKVQERIRRYLSGSLNDSRTYIPINFKIREELTGTTPEFERKSDSLSSLMINDKMDFREYLRQDSLLVEEYKSMLITGWTVQHRFIYKNNSGSLKDSLLTFYLDTAYNIEKVQ